MKLTYGFICKDTKIINNVPITGKELEILSLIAKGYDNIYICKKMSIKLTTLKTHINNLYIKLTDFNKDYKDFSKRVKITLWYYKNVKNINLESED